jgi:very-short-patch-repair endonuclease
MRFCLRPTPTLTLPLSGGGSITECLDFLSLLGGRDFTASLNKFPPPERGRVRVGVRDMSRFTRSKKTTAKARALRRSAREAEKVIWSHLRQAQLLGFSFRRQHSVGLFVLDFYCPTARLAIELDGGQHGHSKFMQRDLRRTAWLAAKGIRVIRFWNNDVSSNLEGVLETIAGELAKSRAGIDPIEAQL